jgi:hypothetical protein
MYIDNPQQVLDYDIPAVLFLSGCQASIVSKAPPALTDPPANLKQNKLGELHLASIE